MLESWEPGQTTNTTEVAQALNTRLNSPYHISFTASPSPEETKPNDIKYNFLHDLQRKLSVESWNLAGYGYRGLFNKRGQKTPDGII